MMTLGSGPWLLIWAQIPDTDLMWSNALTYKRVITSLQTLLSACLIWAPELQIMPPSHLRYRELQVLRLSDGMKVTSACPHHTWHEGWWNVTDYVSAHWLEMMFCSLIGQQVVGCFDNDRFATLWMSYNNAALDMWKYFMCSPIKRFYVVWSLHKRR